MIDEDQVRFPVLTVIVSRGAIVHKSYRRVYGRAPCYVPVALHRKFACQRQRKGGGFFGRCHNASILVGRRSLVGRPAFTSLRNALQPHHWLLCCCCNAIRMLGDVTTLSRGIADIYPSPGTEIRPLSGHVAACP